MHKNIKNPYRGYRKFLWYECELCGYSPKHPSELEGHHIIPQSEFRKRGEKVVHGRNVCTLCSGCHTKVTLGMIVINGRVPTTAGHILEYYYDNTPDQILYSKRGPH